MGRKRDDFWQYVKTSNGNKCIFCGFKVHSAVRIKYHLAQVPEKGIRICDKVPGDVKCAAALALSSSNKRVKQSKTPINLDENDIGSSSSRVSTRAGEVEVDFLPTTELVGEQFQRHLDKIWEWLMRDDVSIMGVWGMGGVGKTALLKHIHNTLISHNYNVIWITVTQDWSLRKLQRNIVRAIDEIISDEDDELKTAAMLLRAFKKMNKCVLILDDVWYDIFLEDVGIPFTDHCGIRTIVASRLLDVCKSIGCKQNIVEVKCLSDFDAFILFSKSLGDDVTLTEDITDIARDLTQECGGLPLAIVTIGRSMRGKEDIREWRDARSKLISLEMDHNEIKRCVFPILKSSFYHLNDRTVQDCILCLPSYRNNLIWGEDLIRRFAAEGLINERQHFQEHLDEGHSILNKLRNDSLLLESEHYAGHFYLHRLVEAMAVNIGEESHGYIYRTELPYEKEWTEDLRKISLISDETTEIPLDMSPKCPKLSTLRMCCEVKVIPDNFFINMLSLRILDLSNNYSIEVLPASISNLECLTALLLGQCKSLHHIPSLANLRQLRRLELSSTAITQVPLGLENLINLRWLDLEGIAVMKAHDLERLPMLESIGATFIDKDEFIACIQIMQHRINSGHLMRGYFFGLVDGKIVLANDIPHDIDSCKMIEIDGVEYSQLLLPSDIDELKIGRCNQWKSLCDVLSIQQTINKFHISKCFVWSCRKLGYLFCSSGDCILCSSLQGLNNLHLSELDSLSMLCRENEMASSFLPFSHLTRLSIDRCNGMKKLLTPRMSTQLHNLEEIEVEDCESMEEIFSTEKSCISDEVLSLAYEVEMDDTNYEAINLPNLKSVILRSLPQLKSVCESILVCGSLKKFCIYDCPQLKCVPQTQPHFEIRVMM